MSSSARKNRVNGAAQLVAIDTDTLKNSLNRLYACQHSASSLGSATRTAVPEQVFEYLWDLKEKALLEGLATVELPQEWLDQLDPQISDTKSVGH